MVHEPTPDPAPIPDAAPARVVVTGGLGFLGRRLAERLIAGSDLRFTHLRLLDQAPAADGWAPDDPRVSIGIGDVADPEFLAREITGPDRGAHGRVVVYHLASVVSAGAEADFDLGYRVNLHGTLGLLERCRTVSSGEPTPLVIFSSSVATYGPSAGVDRGDPDADDSTAQRPRTSYGVQKVVSELLINDYHRKGFIDGRTLRLPTVAVRPGKPNRAASGFASGIIREPLAGIDVICPVRPDTVIAVISPDRVVDALIRVAVIDSDAIGPDRTIMLPGLPMKVEDAIAATEAEFGFEADVGASGRPVDRPATGLGRVSFEPDPEIQAIIDSWPSALTSSRARTLGFEGDSSVAAIVRQHVQERDRGIELEH